MITNPSYDIHSIVILKRTAQSSTDGTGSDGTKKIKLIAPKGT